VLADVNGDGHLDLIGSSAVWRGKGDGTFMMPLNFDGVPGARVRVGDLDGDGMPDLVLIGGTPFVEVAMGTGGGMFSPRREFIAGQSPFDAAIADLDGDGRLDIVASNRGDTTVSVLHGVCH